MRTFQPHSFWQGAKPYLLSAALLAGSLFGSPMAALAQDGSSEIESLCWRTRAVLSSPQESKALLSSLSSQSASCKDPYEKALAAWTLTLGAEALLRNDPTTAYRFQSSAENLLTEITGWASLHPQMLETHGLREPAWIKAQPEAVSLAILAWCNLEKSKPSPVRRELISKFVQGIVLLRHPEPQKYPFCAHFSFGLERPLCPTYAPLLERVHGATRESLASREPMVNANTEGSEATALPPSKSGEPTQYSEVGRAPGAQWSPDKNRQVQALVAAYELLGDKTLLEEANQEGLGIWTHLAVSGKLPATFAPNPQGNGGYPAACVTVDQLSALARVSPTSAATIYRSLLDCAAIWGNQMATSTPLDKASKLCFQKVIAENSKLNSADIGSPVSYQIMQAEDGKAVQKAFETVDLTYPGGAPGKFVRVGRENMFWMRFDVDKEEDYHFYMVFLKSKLEGGLISVLMRIDGDKIFTVPLGGASQAYVDMDFVDGPRRLRSGPHSFGVRFSGLLMTQPALLDSIIAWPVVERRLLDLGRGRRRLLLHNRGIGVSKVTLPELRGATPEITAVDGTGTTASVGREFEKRRRQDYYLIPAGGTALLEWTEAPANNGSGRP